MSKVAEKTRELYHAGALKLSAIKVLLKAGKITQEEYTWIITPEAAEE